MRIGVGTVSQESNTFSPVTTVLEDFERFGYRVGRELEVSSASPGALGGFVQVAEARGDVDLVPLLRARTGAGGRVERAAFDEIRARLAEQLAAAGRLDAVYLELHGAMALTDHDDPEGLILEMVRDHVGHDVLIVASFDHHANITVRKAAVPDVLVGHRTQPHDPPHTGADAARALFRVVDDGVRPTTVLRKAPMVTHQEQYLTSRPPMRTWFDRAREMERRPGVLTVSTFPMQPWLDVDEGGWASVVITDDDHELAAELADELTRTVWELRESFMVRDSVSVEEAVTRTEAAPSGLVVLSDTGDSMLGGSAGDSNVVLAELIRQGVTRTVLVPLVDEPAALRAAELGEGAVDRFALGRSLDPRWGEPLHVEAEVVRLTDGRIVETGGRFDEHEMGTSALLRIGHVLVAVSRYRGRGGVHPVIWEHFGVDPSEAHAVVVKTASNFQHFADRTAEVIRIDTPGHTQSRVTEFDWRRLPRPAFPLDPGVRLSDVPAREPTP